MPSLKDFFREAAQSLIPGSHVLVPPKGTTKHEAIGAGTGALLAGGTLGPVARGAYHLESMMLAAGMSPEQVIASEQKQ